MAEDTSADSTRKKDGEKSSGGVRARLFSKAGLGIFGLIIVLEAAAFMMFFMVGRNDPVDAQAGGTDPVEVPGAEAELVAGEVDDEGIAALRPFILDLDELTVYPQSTQVNAPHRLTAEVKIVISQRLGERLAEDGGKESKAIQVIRLNLRQVLKQMLEEYGVRIVDGSAREAFQHEAKTRLNNVQVEGDRELLSILRILRGHVRQVIIDRLEQSSF